MSDEQSSPKVTLEQLHDRLRDAVEAIETGDQWRGWLDFARRLHRYSFNNLMLIMAQCPEASAVASYTTWKAAKRHVRRGEKSIKVMAPITRRSAETDAEGWPALGTDGRPKGKQRITGFRPVSVFDVGQTDGPPVPEQQRPTLLTGESPVGLWDALAGEVSERGYRLLRAGDERLGTANGMTIPSSREVLIRENVDDLQAAKTLAHELAHVLLHTDSEDAGACRGVIEVEAESVAYLTLAAHGVASDDYSFPYVTHWAYPLAAVEHVAMADIVTRTGQRVMDAAWKIIDATETSQPRGQSIAALAQRVDAASTETSKLREEVVSHTEGTGDAPVLRGVVADAQDFFRQQVAGSWVPAYLYDRGLGRSIDSHAIGFAPAGWTGLVDHLRALGYGDDHMEAAGMATRARTGHLIDRFRNRLTIPLQDAHGLVVGFTARGGPDADDDAPKYLNTSTTSIFRKSEVLFGLSEHADQLGAGYRPVICEGAFDAIAIDLAAEQTGSKMVGVAPCGTALTGSQVERLELAMTVPTIALAYDGDDPGRAASERAWLALTDASPRNVVIAALPRDHDPADLMTRDPSELARAVMEGRNAAYTLASWKIDAAAIDDNPARQVLAFRELLNWERRLPEGERAPFTLALARRLGIDPADAARELAERRPDVLREEVSVSVVRKCDAIVAALDDRRTDPEIEPRSSDDVVHRTIAAR